MTRTKKSRCLADRTRAQLCCPSSLLHIPGLRGARRPRKLHPKTRLTACLRVGRNPLHNTMPANRSAGRDVHLYNPDDLSKPLGGLVLTNGITNENFYAMVEVLVFFSSPYVLRHEDVTDGLRDIPRDEQPLQPGKYYVIAEGRRLSSIRSEAFIEL